VFETRISHWLSATGLPQRIANFALQLLKQLQGGDGNLGIKLVYVTGYKQSNIHKVAVCGSA
jgi:hypothetical protein